MLLNIFFSDSLIKNQKDCITQITFASISIKFVHTLPTILARITCTFIDVNLTILPCPSWRTETLIIRGIISTYCPIFAWIGQTFINGFLTTLASETFIAVAFVRPNSVLTFSMYFTGIGVQGAFVNISGTQLASPARKANTSGIAKGISNAT